MTNLTKVCTVCKTEKEISQFNKSKTCKNGIRSLCKSCQSISGKNYYNKVEKVAPIEGSIENMDREIWMDVSEYEGKYQISNLGRFKRLTHYVLNAVGVSCLFNEKIITPKKAGRGYLAVQLSKGNIKKRLYIHVLVWDHFGDEKRRAGYQVDHKNNIKTDCGIGNLQLITVRLNSSKDRKPETGRTGVTYRNGRYKANIKIGKRGYHLGTFATKEDAERAYQKAIPMAV